MNDTHYKNMKINGKEVIIPAIVFHNSGAICYFNSLIQCLLSSPFFLRFTFETENKTDSIKNEHEKPFTAFFMNILSDQWNMLFTTSLLQHLRNFQPNQSSSEYFILMADSLGWEKLFECQYKLTTRCNECGFTKEKIDVSYNVLVNQFDEFVQTASSLENVVCDGCKNRTTLTEQRKISAVSDMIVISLNKYFMKNIIPYPIQFTLGAFTFRLKGSIEHFGILGGGHYTCRVERQDGYYGIDDSRVVSIDKETFEKPMSETYMVFYDRVLNYQ
jgi:ubiquitin C-terminal hydrolase